MINDQIGKTAIRVATAWKDCITLELAEELRELPFRSRAVAIEHIYERCLRYAFPKVTKLFDNQDFLSELEDHDKKHPGFIALARYAGTTKHVDRILKQIRKLLPAWQDGRALTINDLYDELYPRKQSLGEHEDCLGAVIVSGSYFRCRKCKVVGAELRETAEHYLVLLGKDGIPVTRESVDAAKALEDEARAAAAAEGLDTVVEPEPKVAAEDEQ